ncbi:hypothetical protein [Gulosibacter bifidus]|uniref:Multidrug ABC transporter ATPase n=1 Tax=Gulosibacter bifidus TaxID=272239 RepID=A0ABW5RHZ2_9MICO|nr:hypothetical protein [Gulosibacter bifidus]
MTNSANERNVSSTVDTASNPAAEVAAASVVERTLAYGAAVFAISAFIAMMTLLIAPLTGVDFGVGAPTFWAIVMAVAYYGFPLALLCVVALVITRVWSNRKHANATD